MKIKIGGDRLRSGKGMSVSMHSYERSNHDLSRTIRTSMNAGTLVPVFKEVGLPGDTWDISTQEMVRTIPTNNALFGRFKYQVDFFVVPLRLTVGALHNNMLGVGQNADKVVFPKIKLTATPKTQLGNLATFDMDTQQIAPDSLNKYLGISGVGFNNTDNPIERDFLGVYHIGYYDICKNWYINTQEENAYVIAGGQTLMTGESNIYNANTGNAITTADTIAIAQSGSTPMLEIRPTRPLSDMQTVTVKMKINQQDATFTLKKSSGYKVSTMVGLTQVNAVAAPTGDQNVFVIIFNIGAGTTAITGSVASTKISYTYYGASSGMGILDFPIGNLDKCRTMILKNAEIGEYVTITGMDNTESTAINFLPYSINAQYEGAVGMTCRNSQTGLMLKTHQSDLFNNFVQTSWIDEVNKRSAIQVNNGQFLLDSLVIQKRVYNYLNRIMVSKGTMQDWQEVTYGVDAQSFVESPLFVGGVSGEIVFDEVVSTSGTEDEALGTLAGRGNINYDNRKGGKVNIKVKEPCVIMGIASITPYVDYSQGNDWEMSAINTLEDLHKPEFDGIGFQDLPTEWLAWWDYQLKSNGTGKSFSVGKQPAWIQYMTSVNKVFGDFARMNNAEGMVITRNYQAKNTYVEGQSSISDLTTYVQPLNYNYLFAGSSLEDQPFWMQIHFNVLARRKMSAAIMPRL